MNAIVVCVLGFTAFAIFMLWWQYADRRGEEEQRGWRLRCVAGGRWAYEEKRHGVWSGFEMEEISDCRESPLHLEIMSSARWNEYPEWTHGRREEILARIRLELKEPLYVIEEA